MPLSRYICVRVRNLFTENRIINVTEFIKMVWRHNFILVAEVAAAPNRMRKSAGYKQRSPLHQSR